MTVSKTVNLKTLIHKNGGDFNKMKSFNFYVYSDTID